MGFKDIIQKMGEKQKNRKELLRKIDEQVRIEKIVEERQKSANQRELERYMNDNRENSIKQQLDIMRKSRQNEINFAHNPLNTKNIMKSEWEVLKEKNMFSKTKSDLLNRERSVLKNNKNLLKNNRRICG